MKTQGGVPWSVWSMHKKSCFIAQHFSILTHFLWAPTPQQTICLPKKVTKANSQLAKFQWQEKDPQNEDGANHSSETDQSAADIVKVLEAISTSTLMAKIAAVKSDISLISQDIHKLQDRLAETKTRISRAEDILHHLQHTTEVQCQLQQLSSKQDDIENRLCRSNLRFIGLPESTEGSDPPYDTTYSREVFSIMCAVEEHIACMAPSP